MFNEARFMELMQKYVDNTMTKADNDALREMMHDKENAQGIDQIFQESLQLVGDGQYSNINYR